MRQFTLKLRAVEPQTDKNGKLTKALRFIYNFLGQKPFGLGIRVRVEDLKDLSKKNPIKSGTPNSESDNRTIEETRDRIEAIARDLVGQGIPPTAKRVYDVMNNGVQKTIQKFDAAIIANTDFYPQIFAMIEALPIGKNTKKGKKSIWNNIKEMEPNLTWQTINMAFYDRYHAILKEHDYHQPGVYTKEIKAMCRLAEDRDYPVCPDFKKKSFKKITNPTLAGKDHYLTHAELAELSELNDDLVNGFLCGCYTGVRHSDWKKTGPSNLMSNGSLNIPSLQKGKNPLQAPCHPKVKELWARGVRVISSQKTNEHLARVMPAVGIEKIVTTHTARRTFATLAYQAGMSLSKLHRLTGHSSEKQLRTYLKVTAEDVVEMTRDEAFYKM